MLKIIHSLSDMNFYQLTQVYQQSIQKDGEVLYPHLPKEQRRIQAEQDMYSFLRAFFSDSKSVCAVWICDGNYTSALRLEPYRDGVLLSGLETAPEARRKGYAKRLMMAAVDYIKAQDLSFIYSHVSKNNLVSLSVHKAVGFDILLDHAAYIDGSVSHQSYTLALRIQ